MNKGSEYRQVFFDPKGERGLENNTQKIVSTRGRRVKAAPSYGKTAAAIVAGALVLLLLLLNLFTFVFSVVRYSGDGMEPTLKNRQVLILRKTDQVEEGDMIAFYYNNKALVRRVICTGGKTISLDRGGAVSIEGEALDEPYISQASLGQCNISFPYNVPVGRYFVMGDNRAIAMDSRLSEIGTISGDRIIGKIIFAF